MAGFNSKPTSSRSGSRRESLEGTNQARSLASNEGFMQLLMKLPEELIRQENEINRLKKELAQLSPSRADSYGKRAIHEKWLRDQLEAKEEQLRTKYKERNLQERKRYEQQLQNNSETLEKNNAELNKKLNQSLEEVKGLKKKIREYERQLQDRGNASHRFNYEQQMMKARQAFEEKRRELDRFKERHAAFSERRVRSDQRRTEDTLSTNRQSQLESDYVIEFKDGTRVDAIDIITSKVGRRLRHKGNPMEYLKCCTLACFIFEVAYEVVLNVKESFARFTSSVMDTLAVEAPAIGSDTTTFQSKLWKLQYNNPKVALCATQDAVTEVMILVKERAKTHDLSFLFQDVINSISAKWSHHQLQRGSLLPEFDRDLLYSLDDYIRYCTQFAWCAVTQVPPLKIDYQTAVYSSKSHTVSQAFSSNEERSPTRRLIYSESRNIMCYLWPTLLDCDGNVIRKGEVLLC